MCFYKFFLSNNTALYKQYTVMSTSFYFFYVKLFFIFLQCTISCVSFLTYSFFVLVIEEVRLRVISNSKHTNGRWGQRPARYGSLKDYETQSGMAANHYSTLPTLTITITITSTNTIC
jgi:hypothetical protein